MSISNLKIMYYYIKAVDFNIHLWNFWVFLSVKNWNGSEKYD